MADEHVSDSFIKSLQVRSVQMERGMTHNSEATAMNTSSIKTIRQNTQDTLDTFQALLERHWYGPANTGLVRTPSRWKSRNA